MISQTRYCSSQEVLSLVADMFHSTDWREDGKIYLGRGIMKMGYNWSTKVDMTPYDDPLTVVNHRVEIPCDVEEILQVLYLGQRLPITGDVSMLGLTSDDYIWDHGGLAYYTIDYPYIKTSFETGDITLISKKFRMDKEGFVQIPDNEDYKEALRWYICYNLLLSGYRTKANISWEKAESQFANYKKIAGSQLKRMSKERREQFSRMWTSLNVSYNNGRLTT
tara:strand:- start:59 stop:724 length:666 start_codon:yes stop_codon:yes gene_type:complete